MKVFKDVADVASNWKDLVAVVNNKKIALPVLLVLSVAVGMIAPFWFTGGYVSNAHLVNNKLAIGTSGFGLGSKTILAFKGQTIKLNVEVHEIEKGGVKVYLRENWYTDYADLMNRDSAYRQITKPGKTTVSLEATQTGFYKFSIEPVGTYESKADALTGGKCDVKYSADWDVL